MSRGKSEFKTMEFDGSGVCKNALSDNIEVKDIGDALNEAFVECKELDEGIEVKGPGGEIVKHIPGAIASGALFGAASGALAGTATGGPGNRGKGAKEGAKYGALHGSYSLGMGGGLAGAIHGARVRAEAAAKKAVEDKVPKKGSKEKVSKGISAKELEDSIKAAYSTGKKYVKNRAMDDMKKNALTGSNPGFSVKGDLDIETKGKLLSAIKRLPESTDVSMSDVAKATERSYREGRKALKLKELDDTIIQKANNSHPGFKNVAEEISSKQGIPLENAKAILASKTRKASSSARAKNPNLNKVKGLNEGIEEKGVASALRTAARNIAKGEEAKKQIALLGKRAKSAIKNEGKDVMAGSTLIGDPLRLPPKPKVRQRLHTDTDELGRKVGSNYRSMHVDEEWPGVGHRVSLEKRSQAEEGIGNLHEAMERPYRDSPLFESSKLARKKGTESTYSGDFLNSLFDED